MTICKWVQNPSINVFFNISRGRADLCWRFGYSRQKPILCCKANSWGPDNIKATNPVKLRIPLNIYTECTLSGYMGQCFVCWEHQYAIIHQRRPPSVTMNMSEYGSDCGPYSHCPRTLSAVLVIKGLDVYGGVRLKLHIYAAAIDYICEMGIL